MTTRTNEQSAAAKAGNNGFSLISSEKLLQLCATMVKCRKLAERAHALFPHGKLDINAAIGQEAAAVGVAIDLLPEDTVAAAPRDLIVNFIHGEPLNMLFARLSSRAAQPDQFQLATGAALAHKTAKNGRIAVAFSSDDSASSGLWREALAQAGALQLPILFVCPAQLSPVPLHRKQQTGGGGEKIPARVCGFPCIPVDGNDVVAVYRVATEAIAHARKGNGATLIECSFDRSTAHDPILKMEAYLTRKGLFSVGWKRKVAAGFTRELNAAVEAGTALLNY
jgi:TPP-dependent pyruvate/acetoin dehydrogenase alpha subunit